MSPVDGQSTAADRAGLDVVGPKRWVAIGALAALSASHLVLVARIMKAGFGADNDTFLMLGTWDQLLEYGTYSPSRYQGSPLAEMSIGALSEVGGHWLSGAMSAFLAVVAIWSLHDVITTRIPNSIDSVLLVSILALTPLFLIAGSTSHDYIYGLALFLAGWAAQERGRSPRLVAVVLALATLARLSYLPLALVLLFVGRRNGRDRGRVGSIALYLGVVVVGYVPAYVSAGESLDFLTADRPTGQGVAGIMARAVAKPITLLGIPGTLALIAAVFLALIAAASSQTSGRLGERRLLALLGICTATWIWIPVEPSYLLPTLAIILVWLARPTVLQATRPALVVVAVAAVSLAWIEPHVVTFRYADTDEACSITEAVGASLDPHLEAGQLLRYPRLVAENRPCNEALRADKGQPSP